MTDDLRTSNGIRFQFKGGKSITFRPTDDGLIDVECDPADLTPAAFAFITHIQKLLGR